MKRTRAEFLRQAQRVLLMACAALPLAMIVLAILAPGALRLVWLFAGLHLLLALACLTLPGRARLAVGVLGGLLCVGLGAALLPVGEMGAVMVIPAGYAALLLAGLPIAAWPPEQELSPAWYLTGTVAHVLGYVMANAAPGVRLAGALRQMAPVLPVIFVLFLALTLLAVNRATIYRATLGKQQVPARVRRRNALLTLGFLALVLLVAMIPGITRVVGVLWGAVKGLAGLLLGLLLALIPEPKQVPASQPSAIPAQPLQALPAQAVEPGEASLLLERVIGVVMMAILAFLAALAIRMIYRAVKRLVRYLLDKLNGLASAATEDYVDEVTDTRDDADAGARRTLWDRLRRRLDWGDDRRLPPRERIRRRYQRLQWQHPAWYASRTARENIPGGAAELYERARYSSHDIPEEDARSFADRVRRI